MNKFLKLTSVIINVKHIHKILIAPNKYYIHIVGNNISGFVFFSLGSISSTADIITVCADKMPQDYKNVSEWIDKN